MKSRTAREIIDRIEFLQRNLKRSRLATEEEVTAVASRFRTRNKVGDLWEHWAELKALAIARGHRLAKRGVDKESLEAAVEALTETTETIRLVSLRKTFTICPASYDRIVKVELGSWWLNRFLAGRGLLLHSTVDASFVDKKEVCDKCLRPLRAGKLNKVLREIEREIKHLRGIIYANVIAPTPEPVDEPVRWANKISVLEDRLLLEAWHRVNYDRINRLPQPESRDMSRTLPNDWAFLFSGMAEHDKVPSKEITSNRSLASLIAVMVLESIKREASKPPKDPGKLIRREA